MKGSSFRWLVLVVLVAGTAMLNYSNMVFASRPTDVMAQFGMDQAQLTAISSIGVLPGAFFSVLLGNFFDKRGAGAIRFAGAAMILLAAVCQLWRVYADNYILLFVITFLSGTFFLPTQVLPPKLIEAWFERREIGTAMGVFGSSAGVGIMLAFALSGALSTTSAALMSSAVGFAVVAVLWVALAKLPSGDGVVSEANLPKRDGVVSEVAQCRGDEASKNLHFRTVPLRRGRQKLSPFQSLARRELALLPS